jgi:hypothetical protein
MPINMKCPNCRADVGILRDRYIAPHKTSAGEVCTFTRAPYRDMKAVTVAKLPARQLAKFKAVRQGIADEKEAARKANALRRQIEGKTSLSAASKPKGGKKKKKKPAMKGVCEACGQSIAVMASDGIQLTAHARPSGRWCRGGIAPTEHEKDRKAVGHSVRTVRGGGPIPGNR